MYPPIQGFIQPHSGLRCRCRYRHFMPGPPSLKATDGQAIHIQSLRDWMGVSLTPCAPGIFIAVVGHIFPTRDDMRRRKIYSKLRLPSNGCGGGTGVAAFRAPPQCHVNQPGGAARPNKCIFRYKVLFNPIRGCPLVLTARRDLALVTSPPNIRTLVEHDNACLLELRPMRGQAGPLRDGEGNVSLS